jgi:hypothetical protein
MSYQSKLRWSIGLYYPVVIFSSYIFAILEIAFRKYLHNQGVDISTHPYFTYLLVGLFFILMGVIQWYKYKLWINPVLGFIIGILCFQAPFGFGSGFSIFKITYAITFLIMVLFVIINWRAFYSQERFEINSRRLFRLAAELNNETGDGFTERPFSAGKAEFTKDELQGFSRFLNGRFVAKPFYYEDRIFLAFSMNKSLVMLDDPKEVSYAAFDYNGNVSVAISEKDYRQYVARFNFDRLCDSLAVVFKRFLEYYRQGLEQRIITELKGAR